MFYIFCVVESLLRIWCFSILLEIDGIFPSMVLIKEKSILTSEHWVVMFSLWFILFSHEF